MFLKVFLAAFLAFSNFAFGQDPETLIFAFQKQKDPASLQTATKAIADLLSKETGKKIEVLVPTSYSASVQGLISNRVHVAYMDSLPYVLAKKETNVEILAVEKRNGKTDYDSLIVVKAGSPITSLADLKGKSIAFASQTSTSGYLMPFSRLVAEKHLKPQEMDSFFTNVLYAGGYDKALQAMLKGSTDVAAFSDYAIEGAKADLYSTAEERKQVHVLARTPGVPTHLIAVKGDLSAALKKKVQQALMKISKEKPEVLASVYGAAELVVPKNPEKHVERTLQALRDTGLEVKSFVR